jgi:hypothetical protein
MADYTRGVKRALLDGGCVFVRQGKGDHEIWFSPISQRNFMVNNAIVSRHWANITLKNAGLPKRF